MKFMIASDLHGSAYYVEKLLKTFEESGADRLLLLGDLLYHGPRNDLPRDYNPKLVIPMLNEHRDDITCVRGNCDADVDQMTLTFPITAENAILWHGSRMIFATHGHVFNTENIPPLKKGDILLHGHTHVPVIVDFGGEKGKDFTYLNPGSVSIPKEGSRHSYMIFEDGKFTWYDLETGEAYMYYDM